MRPTARGAALLDALKQPGVAALADRLSSP
jgi:hypothetical protein